MLVNHGSRFGLIVQFLARVRDALVVSRASSGIEYDPSYFHNAGCLVSSLEPYVPLDALVTLAADQYICRGLVTITVVDLCAQLQI